jgi:hypothetical protein
MYQIHKFPDGYDKIAINLLNGDGYRIYPEASETMQRLPGFVFILVGIFYVFGKSLFAVQCFNMACSVATAFLIRHTGRRYLRLQWQADIAAVMFLMYPGVVLADSRGGVESLFSLLTALFVLFLYRALDSDRTREYLFAGVTLGLGASVKSTLLLMGLCFVPYIFFAKYRALGLLRTMLAVVWLVLPMAAVMFPWIIRNYALTGTIVATQTNLGTTAYQGLAVNDAIFTSTDHAKVIEGATRELNQVATSLGLGLVRYDFFQHFGSAQDEVLFDRYVTALVKKRYTDSTMLLIKNCALNFLRFWLQGRTWRATALNAVLVLPFLGLAMFGVYRGFRQKAWVQPPLYFIVVFVAGHLPILTTARYHVTLIPMLALLAALAFSAQVSPPVVAKRVVRS